MYVLSFSSLICHSFVCTLYGIESMLHTNIRANERAWVNIIYRALLKCVYTFVVNTSFVVCVIACPQLITLSRDNLVFCLLFVSLFHSHHICVFTIFSPDGHHVCTLYNLSCFSTRSYRQSIHAADFYIFPGITSCSVFCVAFICIRFW